MLRSAVICSFTNEVTSCGTLYITLPVFSCVCQFVRLQLWGQHTSVYTASTPDSCTHKYTVMEGAGNQEAQ